MFTLLPHDHKRKLLTEYRIRLAIVFFALFSISFGIGIASLFPSFFSVRFLNEKNKAEQEAIQKSIAAKSDDDLETTLRSLKQSLSLLQKQETALYSFIEHIILKKSDAVKITGLQHSSTAEEIAFTIKGEARSRKDLLDYSKTLESGGVFSRIDLPISNFARDIDLPFTLTALVAKATTTK